MESFGEQSLALFKQVEENERKQRNMKPFLRPGSKSFFEHDLKIRLLHQRNSKPKSGEIEFKQTYTCIKKHSSHKKFDELKKITLKEMYVNKVHDGRYLEGKIAYAPFYMTAIQSLIEDENGDIEVLSVYNLNQTYDQDPNILLPFGCRVRIKEPFFKISAGGGDNYTIRVDSPSDIEIIYEDKIPKSISDQTLLFEELNRKGNAFFGQKKYYEALKSYTQALNVKKCLKAVSNRALVYLKLECFQHALIDAEKSIHLEPNEKGFYRLGLALYNMRQFEKSLEQFQNCLKLNPDNKDAKSEVDKCLKRIQETQGVYDFDYLLNQSGKKNLRLDVADFVSDKIEITDITKKGKGVVAKVDIPKNTLIVGSKALSISYDCEFMSKYCLIAYNLLNRTVDMNSRYQNLMNLIYKMRNDPYISEQVYSLYAGKNFDRELKLDSGIIDTERIESIQTFNSFKSEDLGFLGDKKYDNSGVWYMPSFFNHSCLANTTRIFLSDFVLIYTNQEVKKGEELTLSYFPLKSFEEREKNSNHYGFKCLCKMCEIDRKDTTIKKREEMLKNIEKLEKKHDSKKWQNMIEKLNETYKARKVFKYDMIRPLGFLGMSLLKEGKFEKGNKQYIKVYELAKESGDDYLAYKCALKIVEYYNFVSNPAEAKLWQVKADDIFLFDSKLKDYFNQINFDFE